MLALVKPLTQKTLYPNLVAWLQSPQMPECAESWWSAMNHKDSWPAGISFDWWDHNSSVKLRYITVSGLSDSTNLSIDWLNSVVWWMPSAVNPSVSVIVCREESNGARCDRDWEGVCVCVCLFTSVHEMNKERETRKSAECLRRICNFSKRARASRTDRSDVFLRFALHHSGFQLYLHASIMLPYTEEIIISQWWMVLGTVLSALHQSITTVIAC